MHPWRRILLLLAVLVSLFLFICSLTTLQRGFRLLHSQADEHSLLTMAHLTNPALGLFIGIISTCLVQSSATITSLVVAMVASGGITVQQGIPVIMGSNMGTSLTAIIVALTKISNPEQFRLGFTTAILHDMFNWMTILVLFPLEMLTNFLGNTSYDLVHLIYKDNQTIAPTSHYHPFFMVSVVDHIVKLRPPHSEICSEQNATIPHPLIHTEDRGPSGDGGRTCSILETDCDEGCNYIFSATGYSDETIGEIVLICSIIVFILSNISLFYSLNAVIKVEITKKESYVARLFRRVPSSLIECICFISGLITTVFLQSSSAVTASIVPLVSSGAITIERAFPIIVGTNLGTTTTCVLVALGSDHAHSSSALQIALVHCLINIFGFLFFFMIPFMRWPLFLAKVWGSKVLKYKWFPFLYITFILIVLPGANFALSLIGNKTLLYVLVSLICATLLAVVVINYLQAHYSNYLPDVLKTWKFLPTPLRSLSLLDFVIQTYLEVFCCCIVERTVQLMNVPQKDDKDSHVVNLGLGSNLRLVKIEKK